MEFEVELNLIMCTLFRLFYIADLFNLFIMYGKSIYMYLEITMYKYEYQESVSFPR